MGISVRLENVQHEYERTEESGSVRALQEVTLQIAAGDFAILMGPSGSGKSTLLNLIGAVDRPTAGHLFLGDLDISSKNESELTLLRRHKIGFIFQFFNLIPTLNVSDNIGFPLALAGRPAAETRQLVGAVLGEIGLTERSRHYPNQLSGGEMQRVAIGRAIVHRPELILADEPTGNLDTNTGQSILDLIKTVHHSYQPTIVMATHSDRAAACGDYVVDVIDGRVSPRKPHG